LKTKNTTLFYFARTAHSSIRGIEKKKQNSFYYKVQMLEAKYAKKNHPIGNP
jgi:hypothetical protein